MTSLFTHLSMYILVISMSQLLLMLLQCMLVGILLVVQPLLLPCKTETVPMSHPVPFPLSQPLTPSILLSVNMEPTALGALYEWTQTSFALRVWLMSRSIMPSVHPCCSMCQHCLPFRWTTFIVWMDHVLLVHSSVEGHMEYLHLSLTSLIFVE